MTYSPAPNYPQGLSGMEVPPGYLPIKVAQYCRTCPTTGRRLPNRWSIFIPTSVDYGVGNHYELAGDPPMNYARSTFNRHNELYSYERGSLTVGYVSPRMMPILESYFNAVPTEYLRGQWSSQEWVHEVLQTIEAMDHMGMQVVDTTFANLSRQMAFLEAAWEAEEAKARKFKLGS